MVKILLIVGRAELCDPGQLLCRNVRCFCQISLGKAGAIHVVSLLMIGSLRPDLGRPMWSQDPGAYYFMDFKADQYKSISLPLVT